MNNISFSNKFSPQHDNGERNLCWRKIILLENNNYLVTSIYGDVFIIQFRNGKVFCGEEEYPKENIIAYMKLPSPFKPD